ncbi:MAG: hypothetical protein ACXV5I_06415 [Halobacteriota archaeon]
MKRMQLIAAVLCLIMITTVGAGVVAAKQTENPHQAGSSSIYLYDVAATDAHGKGKLQINLAKHTFVFNGQGFTPSAQIELKARAAGSTDYVVFATGKATPSGNLHIAGTWAKDAPLPTDVVGDYAEIAGLGLVVEMGGWFVAKIACYYSTDGGVTWKESDHTSGIAMGNSKVAMLSDLGVPDGALVKIHAIVVGGKDRTGSEVFRYYKYSWWYADYWIKGTTWNPTLTYHGFALIQ